MILKLFACFRSKKFCFTVAALLFFCTTILSQESLTITGNVTDKNDVPLVNANVTIKGSKKGVRTDANGTFNIKATRNAVLVISSVNFLPQEITVGSQLEYKI
ncbi:MAG: carboxypeptidase-like regulatory domain-containing protein, partial [Chitinophagaceae bacterium]